MLTFLPDGLNSDGTKGQLFIDDDLGLTVPLHLLETVVEHGLRQFRGVTVLSLGVVYRSDDLIVTVLYHPDEMPVISLNYPKVQYMVNVSYEQLVDVVVWARSLMPKKPTTTTAEFSKIVQLYRVLSNLPFDESELIHHQD